MDCPAVTTSCSVSAWPLKLYLSRCQPRRSATVEAGGGQIQEQRRVHLHDAADNNAIGEHVEIVIVSFA
jgi:hypothetical protein